jgi:hypothetical protein
VKKGARRRRDRVGRRGWELGPTAGNGRGGAAGSWGPTAPDGWGPATDGNEGRRPAVAPAQGETAALAEEGEGGCSSRTRSLAVVAERRRVIVGVVCGGAGGGELEEDVSGWPYPYSCAAAGAARRRPGGRGAPGNGGRGDAEPRGRHVEPAPVRGS